MHKIDYFCIILKLFLSGKFTKGSLKVNLTEYKFRKLIIFAFSESFSARSLGGLLKSKQMTPGGVGLMTTLRV